MPTIQTERIGFAFLHPALAEILLNRALHHLTREILKFLHHGDFFKNST